jgi:hypothetical protein
MEDKKQDVNSLEKLVKEANAYSGWFANLANELSKVVVDIQTPKKEEDRWEMKCPFQHGDYHWIVYDDGAVGEEEWLEFAEDDSRFLQGNIFPTKQAAELESKRRNLLTRFRAFRNECNNGWKLDWKDCEMKWDINYKGEGLRVLWTNNINSFSTFGYFKNRKDAQRAIELFGDEIKKLFVDCECD